MTPMTHGAPAQKALTRAVAIALGSWTLVGAGAALAQVAVPAGSSPAPSAEAGQLSTVTVTANRRIEDQQKVSTSVTALSGEKLAERNIYDISQLEGLSPGFTFGRSGADARPAMRGVRTEAVQANADPTIGFFVDGIYKSRPSQALASFVDVERVEVQRGPQGTLFGRNTFGGNIVLSTVQPQLGETLAFGSVLLGSQRRLRVEGVANVPFGQTVAVRVATAYDKADGYVRNDFNRDADLFDQDLKYLRASIKFEPDSRFVAVLKIDATEQRGNGAGGFSNFQRGTYLNGTCRPLLNSTFYPINGRAGLLDGTPDCTRTAGIPGGAAAGTSADIGRPIYSPGNAYRVENNYQSEQRLSDASFTADVSYRFDAFTLKSITGYSNFSVLRTVDQDFSRENIAVSYERTKDRAVSQELQVLSEGKGPFGYVAGVYFLKDEINNLAVFQSILRTAGNGSADTVVADTDSRAAYGQLSFKARPDLTFTAGLRYTEDRKKYRFANRNSVVPISPATSPDPFFTSLDDLVAGDAAFGSAGTTNCGNAVGGFPAGAVIPGANCGGTGNNVFQGATFTPVKFTKTTGRLAAEYNLSKDQLLYLSYSTGFSSGGFNGSQTALVTEATRTFSPQEVKAFEVGSKNRFLGNTLQLNVAAFSNRYTDQQEQRQVPVGIATASLLFNAAKSKANGLEIETEWRATPAFSVGATLSLLDAKYTSFPDAPGPIAITQLIDTPGTAAVVVNGVTISPAGQTRVYAPGYSCALINGTGVNGVPQAYGCDLMVKKIPYAADYSGSVFTSYTFDLGKYGKLTPTAIATFSSGYFGQIYNVEAEKQGSYVKADLKLAWVVNDKLAFQFFVDNINDKQVINRFVWGGGSTLQASVAPPRTFGLKVSYSFL